MVYLYNINWQISGIVGLDCPVFEITPICTNLYWPVIQTQFIAVVASKRTTLKIECDNCLDEAIGPCLTGQLIKHKTCLELSGAIVTNHYN